MKGMMLVMMLASGAVFAVEPPSGEIEKYIGLIRDGINAEYTGMFREKGGIFKYPFLVPGSKTYADVLWDWDSWLSNVALRQILAENNDPEMSEKALQYEMGCVLNFLEFTDRTGWMPIVVSGKTKTIQDLKPAQPFESNMHKPVIAQHAAFLTKIMGGDAEWLRGHHEDLQRFINNYRNHHRHRETGLYYWQDDLSVGVDNDPCSFYRPKGSCASIYLNCLMYKELLAAAYLADRLGLNEIGDHHRKDAEDLLAAVREHCWDEWTGFYYSCDINLLPYDHYKSSKRLLHSGQPRDWDCLIMRIGVWSGFMTMWAGIATPEQSERMVEEHLKNEKTFCAPYGIRTLSKMEKMYNVRASGNPSSWLGPIWGISNYMVFKGLVDYGFEAEARDLAEKTIRLFGRDYERFGALHEYYQPENGEPILNRGFQNWNYLVLNMINWYEGKTPVWEF